MATTTTSGVGAGFVVLDRTTKVANFFDSNTKCRITYGHLNT